MSDIREGLDRGRVIESGATLRASEPVGSEIELHDDGTATFHGGDEPNETAAGDHFDNLAETLDETRLSQIAADLLDAIEIDKTARQARDQQYAEGLRRTGLGNDAPGGAPFNGASRAVHPLLTEAILDYAGRVAPELIPPTGPVKPFMLGVPTNDKLDRAERTTRYMNYQLTEVMESFSDEVEVGLSQQGLAGAFYLKPIVIDGKPDVEVVHIDKVLRPWGSGSLYVQPRITHEMDVDRWDFQSNVASGLWRDGVVDPSTGASDTVGESQSEQANDRIIGRDQPTENVDDIRVVYETSTRLALNDGDEVRPYIVTIDEQSRKVLAIYRNWDEDDDNFSRLDFLIEFPFWPFRGGYPIGLGHMIGSLSGAASGSLRALLDSALLNCMQTGVKLKGGATSGGQNIRPQVGSTTEVQGSLAMDDIRKTYMPLEFPPPSPVLFQLLGFLVDAGRGVVRTTFDEFNKMTGETPVGTANLMVEQGLKSYGAVFRRQHRAMHRFLKMLWRINAKTVENEAVVDQFGELVVTREDFTGPMCVQPVSDPTIFSDAQRQAMAMYLTGRIQALAEAAPAVYKIRQAELFGLKQMKVPDPEQFLVDAPEPQQLDAASENVAACQGLPIKAFAGQDHEAHIAQHAAFMQAPIFGSNPVLAMKFLPPMLQHFADHLALWYGDAMMLATDGVLQKTFGDPRITLESLRTVDGLEADLDRLMAELTPDVIQHGNEQLRGVLDVINKAQALIKQLSPPQPMDPSVVAQQDVQRQAEKDKADIQLDNAEQQRKASESQANLALKAKEQQDKTALEQQKHQDTIDLKSQELEQRADDAERKDTLAAANVRVAADRNDVTRETTRDNNATQLAKAHQDNAVKVATTRDNNDTQIEITRMDNQTAEDIAHEKVQHDAKMGNLKDGTGIQK